MSLPTRSDNLDRQRDLLVIAALDMAEARSALKKVVDLRAVFGEMTKGNGTLADIIHYLGEFAEDIKLIEVSEE